MLKFSRIDLNKFIDLSKIIFDLLNELNSILKQKGIDDKLISSSFDEFEYSEFDVALNFARKKKIGRFRENKISQEENRQKDLATLVRAGFDYDIAKEVVYEFDED